MTPEQPAAVQGQREGGFPAGEKDQGRILGEITAKTGIPKTSLHRYLVPAPAAVAAEESQ